MSFGSPSLHPSLPLSLSDTLFTASAFKCVFVVLGPMTDKHICLSVIFALFSVCMCVCVCVGVHHLWVYVSNVRRVCVVKDIEACVCVYVHFSSNLECLLSSIFAIKEVLPAITSARRPKDAIFSVHVIVFCARRKAKIQFLASKYKRCQKCHLLWQCFP